MEVPDKMAKSTFASINVPSKMPFIELITRLATEYGFAMDPHLADYLLFEETSFPLGSAPEVAMEIWELFWGKTWMPV